jgi:hypothetical protein
MRLPIISARQSTIHDIFHDNVLVSLDEEATRTVIARAALPLRSGLEMEHAIELVQSVVQGVLTLQYRSLPATAEFIAAREKFDRFVEALNALDRTIPVAPHHVRRAVYDIQLWLNEEGRLVQKRKGQKAATRRRRYRDRRIVELFVNLFGLENLTETVKVPGISANGSTACFVLAFFDAVRAWLDSSRACPGEEQALEKLSKDWKADPTPSQIRTAVRDVRTTRKSQLEDE